jgi:hypothetical protein
MSKIKTRGVRNNNPGNIRISGDNPQGLAEEQLDPSFFTFKDPVYGIRYIARILITYQNKHNLRTPREIILRYAPPGDNNPTDIYAANVAAAVGVSTDTPIDVKQYAVMRPLVEAIITQENGVAWSRIYTTEQLDKALLMAGIQPPLKPITKSRTVRSAATAAAATVATTVSTLPVETIQAQLSPFSEAMPWIKTVLLVCVLIGLARIIYVKRDDRKKGL